MQLTDYIQKHYNGNKTAFANDNNTTKQAVWGMINKGGYYVYDGMLMLCRKELTDKESE